MNAFANNANGNTNARTSNNGSFNTATFVGLRIAGNPTYVPSHINANGKLVQSMCTFTAYQNLNGKPNRFRFTAWGGMADALARAGSVGKEITIQSEIRSFQGQVVQQDAQGKPYFVQNAQGQALEVEKTGFEVKGVKLGEDSRKTIDKEIQEGIRGAYWQVPGTQDEANWRALCKQRNEAQFDVNSPWFGYAQVRMPKNGQVVDAKAYRAQQNGSNAGTAQFAGNMQAVGQVMNPNPAPAPQYQQAPQQYQQAGQPQPVMVHGQNMGYPMAPAQGGFNSTPPNTPAPVQQAAANQAPPIYV